MTWEQHTLGTDADGVVHRQGDAWAEPTTPAELAGMRCLTVLQPMGSAIMDGGKRVENRPMRLTSDLPRLLVIHAGARWWGGVDIGTGCHASSSKLRPPVAAWTERRWAGPVPELAELPRRALLGVVRVSSVVSFGELQGMTIRQARDDRQWALGAWCWRIDRAASAGDGTSASDREPRQRATRYQPDSRTGASSSCASTGTTGGRTMGKTKSAAEVANEGVAAIWFAARELAPWESNYLDHPDPQLQVIGDSIARNGWGSPCVALEGTNRLIIGHGRLAAFLRLLDAGELFDQVPEQGDRARLRAGNIPVRFRSMPLDRAAELAVADNESVRLARRKDGALERVVAELQADSSTKVLDRALGMRDRDVRKLLRRPDGSTGGKVDPPPPEVPDEPDSKLGQLFELGPHRLVCGDSHKPETMAQLLEGKRVGLVFTDPPYAIYGSSTGVSESVTDDRIVLPFFRQTLATIQENLHLFGPAYVCCDWRSWSSWWESARGLLVSPKNMLVWDKGGSGLGNNWANTHELIGYYIHLPPAVAMTSGRPTGMQPVLQPNVLHFGRPRGHDRQHNAAKPVELIEHVLVQHDEHGDRTVLDLFGGSGSTLIAAARAGWLCRMAEVSPAWCDVIRRRWTAYARAADQDPGPGALG